MNLQVRAFGFLSALGKLSHESYGVLHDHCLYFSLTYSTCFRVVRKHPLNILGLILFPCVHGLYAICCTCWNKESYPHSYLFHTRFFYTIRG